MKRTGFTRSEPYRWKRSPLKRGKYGLRRSGRLKAKPDRKLAAWSKKVRERDGNQCQWPEGCQTGDTRIDAHHIAKRSQRPDLKYSIENGICLCRTHHDATDTDRATAIKLGMLSTETYEARAEKEAA